MWFPCLLEKGRGRGGNIRVPGSAASRAGAKDLRAAIADNPLSQARAYAPKPGASCSGIPSFRWRFRQVIDKRP